MYTKYRRKTMDELAVKALAKINLGLDVLRRREDGYHEVKMVMQTIHLYDQLHLKKIESGIYLETNLGFLPVDESNLAYRAARLMKEKYQIEEGIDIRLNKRIPVAAGMAGGSTDAAGVLYGINELFNLGIKRKELMELGVQIGADVPYCIMRGTALAEGIGEKLTSLPPMVKCPVVIAKPQVSVSTKYVYENLKLDEHTQHPDIDALIQNIRTKDLPAIAGSMGNLLETITAKKYPEIEKIKELMRENGALNAMMSGSGPTVFGLFDELETAKMAAAIVRQSGLARQVFVTEIYNNRR
jgi:4-diphosphocytidyl-2-C-methyl-D-erythritol kinase